MAPRSFRDAVRAVDGAVALDLDVTPGARTAAFPAGFDPWRRRIGIRVRAAAQDGKANAAVCALVAEHLEVPVRAVTIVQGASSGQKTIQVQGADQEDVVLRLGAVLA